MTGSLYLSPQDPWQQPPARDAVLTVLRQLQLLGDRHADDNWLAGDRLLQHITFAGCSPYLEFAPPTDGSSNFCHLTLLGPFDSPRIYSGAHTLKPRCPTCKTRVADWQALAASYQADPRVDWTCPNCGATQAIDSLRWRHHAAFGRLLVEIHSVFPAEGVPSDELLSALGEATGGKNWQYAWAASST